MAWTPNRAHAIGITIGSVNATLAATGHHGVGVSTDVRCAGSGSVDASYPAFVTAACRSNAATSGRACTVARSVARFTAAEVTPGTLRSAFSTRLEHDAQVMPS